ncbi:MAG: hypothetical protein CMI53_01120 [Parcubacteria group bacterium]|nr:hypothetical protein [Parcubacteria group bacterium]|tara:strand:- start:14229 stop:15623 length:1395 start_codon:yes stop_codon:yes gene_type:complete
MEIKSKNLSYLIIAHILILLGYSMNKGLFIHQAQLWFLFLGLLVLVLIFLKKFWLNFNFNLNPLTLLLTANLISFVLFYFIDGGIFLISNQAYNNTVLLKFFAISLFFLYLVDFSFKQKNFFSIFLIHLKKYKFVYLVSLALILRLATIFYSPQPRIDIFWLLQGASDSLITGNNPYSGDFYNVYSPAECEALYQDPDCKNDNYSYLPSTMVATTFFKFLFGDIRFTFVFSIFGTAAIIYSLLKKKFSNNLKIAELSSLLILYLPLSLYVLEQTWVDSLSLFLLYLFVFLVLRGYKYVPYVVFGLFLSSKQPYLIFLPFLARFQELNFKKFFLTLITLVIIVLPFAVWNFNDFIYDVFLDQLQYEDALHSLSFNSLNKIIFYDGIPLTAMIIALIFLLLFLLIKTQRTLSGIIFSGTIFLLSLYLIKRGFTNYYFGISGILILLIVLEIYKLDVLPKLKNNHDH